MKQAVTVKLKKCALFILVIFILTSPKTFLQVSRHILRIQIHFKCFPKQSAKTACFQFLKFINSRSIQGNQTTLRSDQSASRDMRACWD